MKLRYDNSIPWDLKSSMENYTEHGHYKKEKRETKMMFLYRRIKHFFLARIVLSILELKPPIICCSCIYSIRSLYLL